MRKLERDNLIDIITGCALLGTGGGGSLPGGLQTIKDDIAAGHEFWLATLEELDEDQIVACPYGAGAVSPKTERQRAQYAHLPRIEQSDVMAAFLALEGYLGTPIDAVLTTELGAQNAADAFSVAAHLQRPIVDADPTGRSVPELQQQTFTLHDIPITPMSVATKFGDTAIFTSVVDDVRAERMVRALATVSDNLVGVTDHPLKVADVRGKVIEGAISQAEHLGAALRTANDAGQDGAAAVASAGGGAIRFRGTLIDLQWETLDAFTVGTVTLEGTGTDSGSTYEVRFKNEHYVAYRDAVLDVVVPDLIALVTAEGQPTTTPNYTTGTAYTVVALPAPDPWTTPRGLELLGPGAFGLHETWTPGNAGQHPG